MKSSQLLSNAHISVVPRIRLSKGFAALFAAALAMGLGVESALAQGGYYPQVAPLGGSPFIPNGYPVVSNSELNLIENNMPGTATLVIPAVAPKTVATLAEYKLAVKAAATAVANGAGGSVTLASLAAEVAKYRQLPVSQVSDGLGSIAAGIIASGSGTKSADLQALAYNAARVNPAGATSGGILIAAFTAAAADNTLVADVDSMVNSALLGAVSGSPAPAALTSSAVKTLIANAVSVIANAPAANAATATNALKGGLISALATTVIPTLVGSPVNIDQASASLLAAAVAPYVTPSAMTTAIKAAVPATDVNYGAIAQGGLRGNPAASAAIKAALSTAYTDELIDAFNAFAAPGSALALAGAATNPAAISAAGVTKFGASAPAIVRDVLIGAASGVALERQEIIGRGVAAATGVAAQNIATAAVGFGGATLTDVSTGAIASAPISSAGAITAAVIIAGGLSNANAAEVGGAAIAAAASVSPVANKPDAYADIAFNLANALKLAGAVGDARNSAATTAEVLAILAANGGGGTEATSPSYIAVVSAAAAASANRAAILAAGNAAVVGDEDTASSAGVALLNAFTSVPLTNYQATLSAISLPGTDARNLAVLYAASLGNQGDLAGGLAALIAKTATSPTALTTAAVSANRTKQTGLTIAAEVAVYAKANPLADIQATIGHQILVNPTYLKEISVAATVVVPQWSHNIAHTVAFNQPKTASDSVGGIFLHSRITNTTGVAGVDRLTFGDRPGAGAAITAGLATGILESTQLTAAERKAALQGAIVESVKALVNPLYNKQGAANFALSDGVSAVTSTTVIAKGVAGGITGFVAQLVKTGDTAAVVAPGTDIYNALFHSSYNAGLLTGNTYQMDIVQAAAQAFGWITGTGVTSAALEEIANAVYTGYPVGGAPQLAKLKFAVAFGLSQGAGGVPGVGALGLRNGADPAYTHKSASGTPVSNIFSL